MRLEKKREQELADRKGLTGRTIFQFIWFLISGIVSFFGVRYLFNSEILSDTFFYTVLSVPAAVPLWAIMALLIVIGIFLMNFFVIIGYALFSPDARRRTGKPTAYSRNPDPYQDDYRR